MRTDFNHNMDYFLRRLTFIGATLGALFGILIGFLPGAVIGLFWGMFAGAFLSMGLGVRVTLFNRGDAVPQGDAYRETLVFRTGLITTIVMALPLLLVFAPVAGLAAAYVAHQYADDHEGDDDIGKAKNEATNPYDLRDNLIVNAARQIYGRAVNTLYIGIPIAWIGFLTFVWLDPFTSLSLAGIIASLLLVIVGAATYGVLVTAAIAFINAIFIKMANRLFFTPETSALTYRRTIVTSVGLLTLLISSIVTFGIGAPVMAAFAAMGANRYVDWYFDSTEKRKRQPKVDSSSDDDRLEQATHTLGDMLYADEDETQFLDDESQREKTRQ